MKSFVRWIVLSLGLSFSAFAVPHLDPEMTGFEYRALLEQLAATHRLAPAIDAEDAAIEDFLALGKRNLDWVDFVNQNRPAGDKISLSSPATQGGNPVSRPRFYNFQIIQEQWAIVRALLPTALKAVIFEGATFTAQPPGTDREFVEWLAQVDNAYQIAARYKVMKPYQGELSGLAAEDVRGFAVLSGTADLNAKLNGWPKLSQAMQARLGRALTMVCLNQEGQTAARCQRELVAATARHRLVAYKDRYLPAGQAKFDSYFNIPVFRSDATWTSANPNLLSLPFADPRNEVVREYLQSNIEDEFRFGAWRLRLDFQNSSSPTMTHVVFEAGAVPHVDVLAGSEITMDANAPLSEYDVQWTIRHEYGHVLGFPDCYFESYDEESQAFMSYQLDVTNLMCSRRGKLQERHYQELKRVYFHQ